MATESEGSTDFVLSGNMTEESGGSTDSQLWGNTTDESEGSTDFVLSGNMATKSEGSTDSVLLRNMTDENKGSTDSQLWGNTTDESEGSTDSVLLGNMATQSEGSTDFVLLRNMTDENENSTDSQLWRNTADESGSSTDSQLYESVTDESEGSTDSDLLGSMTDESEDSCIGNDTIEPKSVKILILGSIGTGKTTLIKSYFAMMNIPVEELDITELDLFAMYSLRRTYKGTMVDLGLLDLYPGAYAHERRECYPLDVNAIILCFSIGHYDTLKSVYNLWIHEVRSHFGKLTPVVLVGLKSDTRLVQPGTLLYSLLCREGNRIVEKSEAEVIHKKYKFHGNYMECSVWDRDSVIHVMQQAFLIAMEG